MGEQRPHLSNVRGAQESRHRSSSGRLGPGRRPRMALLASPDVGVRGRALLKKRRSFPFFATQLPTKRGSHRRFEHRKNIPAGSLNQAIVGPLPRMIPFLTLAFLLPNLSSLLFRYLRPESFCVELFYFS